MNKSMTRATLSRAGTGMKKFLHERRLTTRQWILAILVCFGPLFLVFGGYTLVNPGMWAPAAPAIPAAPVAVPAPGDYLYNGKYLDTAAASNIVGGWAAQAQTQCGLTDYQRKLAYTKLWNMVQDNGRDLVKAKEKAGALTCDDVHLLATLPITDVEAAIQQRLDNSGLTDPYKIQEAGGTALQCVQAGNPLQQCLDAIPTKPKP
jgi:hypothetical protein